MPLVAVLNSEAPRELGTVFEARSWDEISAVLLGWDALEPLSPRVGPVAALLASAARAGPSPEGGCGARTRCVCVWERLGEGGERRR